MDGCRWNWRFGLLLESWRFYFKFFLGFFGFFFWLFLDFFGFFFDFFDIFWLFNIFTCAILYSGLSVFNIGKRKGQHFTWEPIFIGTNNEPYYDDRLTWDGRNEKMTQVNFTFFTSFLNHYETLCIFKYFHTSKIDFRVKQCVGLTMSFTYWTMHFWFTDRALKFGTKTKSVTNCRATAANWSVMSLNHTWEFSMNRNTQRDVRNP